MEKKRTMQYNVPAVPFTHFPEPFICKQGTGSMDREKPIILINDLPPFLKRLYRENPYCVLGLAAGAPRRDAEDAMRRMKTFEMLPVEKRTPAAAERILKAPALSGLEWPERSSAVYNSLRSQTYLVEF